MKYILILFAALSLQSQLFGQSTHTVKGYVFDDLNGNSLRDKNESGIASVAVSNGSEVVVTDQDGRYSLPVPADEAIIFVIKPGDYIYPVNELNQPQFYYLHKPKGSPELKFAGTKSTGSLPESVDFPLIKDDVNEEFSIVVFSDPQPYAIEEVGYYDRSIVEELVGAKEHAFGITMGDLVGDDLSLFEPLNQATSRIGLPWFHVIGNHDLNFDAEIWQHADETFENTFGPATYAFNHGKVHFIVLNNVIYPNTYNSRYYVGGLRDDQFAFIENSLKYVPEDCLVVLNMHIPIYNEAPWGETFKNDDRIRLFKLLEKYPHTLSFSGHTHTQRHYFFGEEEGWLQPEPHHHYTVGTAGGDWWSGEPDENGVPVSTMYDGTPKGYNIIHFNGNEYRWDYKVAGNSPEYKMELYGPRTVPHNKHFRGELYVNFFQGSEKDLVEFKVNDGEWRKMRYVVEFDPGVCAMRYRWDNSEEQITGTRPSNPVNCFHLWKTRVPTNVEPGENTIFVRVTDVFGRIYEEEFTYQVVISD